MTRDLAKAELAKLDDAKLVERTSLAIEAWRRSYDRESGRAAPADDTEEDLCRAECSAPGRRAGLYGLALAEANRRRAADRAAQGGEIGGRT